MCLSAGSSVRTPRLLAFAVACLCATPAFAQNANEVTQRVPAGATNLRACYTHDGENTIGYRLYQHGSQIGPDYSLKELQNGRVCIPLGNLPVGSHPFEFAAFNSTDATFADRLIVVMLQEAPTKPGEPKVEFTAKVSGILRFEVQSEPAP